MATFDATTSAVAIDFNTLNLADILSGTFVTTTSTLLRVDLGGGEFVDLVGTGLTYSGATVTGGTFLSIENTVSGNRVYLISGISIAATDYAAFNLANDNTGLLTTLFGGADTILGSGFDDVLIGAAGADDFSGGAGTDTVSYGTAAAGVRAHLIDNRSATGDAAGDTFSSIENLTGSAFDDLLRGDLTDNVIRGQSGDDNLYGLDGDDTLYGGAGRDYLVGGAGADLLFGGAGSDTASYESVKFLQRVDARLSQGLGFAGDAAGDRYIGIENLYGGGGDDYLEGDNAANVLYGGGGDDVIRGLGGDDKLIGASGRDTMYGGDGDDTLIGGTNDSIFGDTGSDTIFSSASGAEIDGGAGTDTVSYRDLTSDVYASLVSNTGRPLSGNSFPGDSFANVENLTGGKGNDILEGDSTVNVLRGGAGNDILFGGAGADVLDGGTGTDTADYGAASAAVDARLIAGQGFAGDANGDSFTAIENLLGGDFDDILVGNQGANTISGSDGNDNLNGLGGDDTISGGAGDDTLYGRAGADILAGGAGNDLFVFEPGHGADRILDFEAGAGLGDRIFFDNGVASPNSFADVQAASSQVGTDTVIDLGGGDTITLFGIDLGTLAADDFLF